MNDFINIYLNNNKLRLLKGEEHNVFETVLNCIERLKTSEDTTIILSVADPVKTIQQIYTHYKQIIACGGIIENEQKDILFIYRRNKWDLPKGKLDSGESNTACALREVKEETGLTEVKLNRFICTCYHIYFDKYSSNYVLKETFWYSMTASAIENLIPQAEEDITAIQWVNKKELSPILQNSFKSIAEVMEKFLISN